MNIGTMEVGVIRPAKTLAAVLLIAVGLGAPLGCSPAKGPLDGTRWRLDVWTLSSLSPRDFTITAEFVDGRVSGRSGVNTYSGPYQIGPGRAFSAGPLTSTQMAGPEPAMRTETAYLMLLRQARSFEMTDSKLTLFDEIGSESLNFEPAP